MIDRLTSDAAAAAAAAESYAGDPNDSLLASLNTSLDGLLDDLEPMTSAAALLPPEQMREQATAYRRSAGQLIRSMSEEIDGLSERLATLNSSLETNKTTLDKVDSQAEANLDRLRQAIDSQETRVTSALRIPAAVFRCGGQETAGRNGRSAVHARGGHDGRSGAEPARYRDGHTPELRRRGRHRGGQEKEEEAARRQRTRPHARAARFVCYGVPGRIRTCDRRFRKPLL